MCLYSIYLYRTLITEEKVKVYKMRVNRVMFIQTRNNVWKIDEAKSKYECLLLFENFTMIVTSAWFRQWQNPTHALPN